MTANHFGKLVNITSATKKKKKSLGELKHIYKRTRSFNKHFQSISVLFGLCNWLDSFFSPSERATIKTIIFKYTKQPNVIDINGKYAIIFRFIGVS